MRCRVCGNAHLKPFLSLGTTPLANRFLSAAELGNPEPRFSLELCFCESCAMVQLGHTVPAEEMFRNYVYVSSTTETFRRHFSALAEHLVQMFSLGREALAVDIGSNDGLLLSGFQKRGVQVVGVEPAKNIAALAEKNGVATVNRFFDDDAVHEILQRKGKADVITATNVFAHVDDISSFAGNVKSLLKPSGVFVIEVQYLADMLEKMTFDNVYHEHLSYFSLTTLVEFFKRNGLEVFRAERVDTHGGSLRVFIQNPGARPADPSVAQTLSSERQLRMGELSTYQAFAGKVGKIKQRLVARLAGIKAEGKRIAAYGAPAKGSTLLNFCGIGKETIDFIAEDNPLKVGLYAPGTHIPVVSPSELASRKPDYVLLLAWNFADEILAKTAGLRERGMRFIIPLPEIREV